VGFDWMLGFKRLKTQYIGNCFYASFSTLVKLHQDGIKAELIHGYIDHGEREDLRLIHAWVETTDKVFDWSSGIEEPVPKHIYYSMLNPEIISRYDVIAAVNLMAESNHYGPWLTDLMTVVKKGDEKHGE